VIFFYFLQSAGVGCFLRYLDRGPKELFFSDKPKSEDLIFKLKTLPKKNRKIYAIDTKDGKIQ
jgi:hypothetical protein